jgi:hypothetical protein
MFRPSLLSFLFILLIPGFLIVSCGSQPIPSGNSGGASPTFTSTPASPTNTPTPYVQTGTVLSAGDVVFLAFTTNGTANDQFAFMIMKPVVAGTSIDISDENWDGSKFGLSDGGVILWVADKAYPAGTIIQALPTTNGSASTTKAYAVNIYSGGVTYSNVATATVTPGTYAVNASSPVSLVTVSNTGGGITGLSKTGDQLFAYQGPTTLAAPAAAVTFLGGFTYGGPWLTGTPTPTNATGANSYLPPGLIDGQSAMAINVPYGNGGYYNTSAGNVGTEAALNVDINNASNWTLQMTPADLPKPAVVSTITVQ